MKQAAQLFPGSEHHVGHFVGAFITAPVDVIGPVFDDIPDRVSHPRGFGERGAAVVEIDFLHDKSSNKRAVSSQRDTARPDVPLLYMKGGDKTMFIDKIYKCHLKY